MKILFLKISFVVVVLMISFNTYAQPPVPNTTFTYVMGCTSGTFTRQTDPPAQYDWFWQTSATGTATDKGSGPSYTSSTGGWVYLRARTKTTPYQWSSSSQTAGKIIFNGPSAPASSTDGTRIGPGDIVLSVADVSGASAYRWFTQSTGGTAVAETPGTAATLSVSATTTFYVAAVVNGCEGARRSVTATVDPRPVVGSVGSNVLTGGGSTVTLNVSTSYATYTWYDVYGNNRGTGATHVVTLAGYYYVRVTKSGYQGSGESLPFLVKGDFQNQNQNYVITNTVQVEGITNPGDVASMNHTQRSRSIQYFDGLGRLSQTVLEKGSPQVKDVITPNVYDKFSREDRQYLPYVDANNGLFNYVNYDPVTNAYTGIPGDFYTNNPSGKVAQDSRAFSKTVFEASPLKRPLKEYGPGADWHDTSGGNTTGKDKFSSVREYPNEHGSGVSATQEKVISWKVDATSGLPVRFAAAAGYVETGGYYSTGQLMVKVSTDENGNAAREFTNLKGQVILRKVQVNVQSTPNLNSTTDWALTYYVFDDFGNLRYVFQPELSKIIHDDQNNNPVATADLDNWAFQYKYDARQRMTEKRVPGSSWVYMVYDDRDRLVLTQDGNQRSTTVKTWSFTKYDGLNRPVATGIKDTTLELTQTQMQGVVNAFYAKGWTRLNTTFIGEAAANNMHGYDQKSYPVILAGEELNFLTVTYYDDYNFRSAWIGDYAYKNESLSYPTCVTCKQPATEFLHVRGQATGIKVKVLDGGPKGGWTWLKTVNYYDNRYRVIQTIADNYVGGTDRTTSIYDFSGKILKTKTTHVKASVTWTKHVKVKSEGNKLVRNVTGNTWDGGAVSQEVLPANTNGWVEFVIGKVNQNRMIGLSQTNVDEGYASMDYALYPLTNGSLRLYEKGVQKAQGTLALKYNDVIKIERIGTTIKIYKNNFYWTTAPTASTGALMVDASIATGVDAFIQDVRSSFSMRTDSVVRTFEYDHGGRLTKVWHRLNNGNQFLLAANEYNELGQLVDKKLHSALASGSDAKQSVDTRYNIRGWIASINNSELATNATNDDSNDYFGMNLAYNNAFAGVNDGVNDKLNYNGNISAIKWNKYLCTADIKEQGYSYAYDAMGRLASGNHKYFTVGESGPGSWGTGAFHEIVSQYDLNGNILALQRNDEGGQIDNLTYNYVSATIGRSNQLVSVTDNSADAVKKLRGFVDGNPGGTADYEYDANGNLFNDYNKGLSVSQYERGIKYNILNLPEWVTRAGNTVHYIYDATGRKLEQEVSYAGSREQAFTNYSGEFVFENNVLQYVNHEEGRIVVARNKLVYKNPADITAGFTPVNTTVTQVTQADGEKYVKAVPTSTTAGTGIFPIGSALPVTANERYKIRIKGYRIGNSASDANFEVKVNGVKINSPGAALPIANARPTESWIEQVVRVPASGSMEVGVVWATVTVSGESLWINEIEIIRLETTAPEYQYFLKDHLGNVRVTFTTVPVEDEYRATLEDDRQTEETATFRNYSRNTNDLFDHTDAGTVYNKSQLLNGGNNSQVGLAKTLAVGPGDVIKAEVYAKCFGTPAGSTNLSGFATALLSAFGLSTPAAGELGTPSSALQAYGSLIAGGGNGGDPNRPQGWLNILVFDKDYNLVDVAYEQMESGYVQPGGTTTKSPHQLLSREITIKEPGYVYIYISNEGALAQEIYFDDFKILHTQSPIIQMQDYYPYGLTFNEWRRENGYANSYQYNGKEKQDELGLEWLDYGARMYMSDIGRWGVGDPLSEKYLSWSIYAYVMNNPLSFMDPTGMFSTHTDEEGNVVAVYQDGDLGVYKHEKNADGGSVTQAQLDKRHDKSTSAGGKKMGVTVHELSFADFDNPINSDGSVNAVGRIDFNSTWAGDQIDAALGEIESFIGDYTDEATGQGKYNLKVHSKDGPEGIYYGSQVSKGVYGSARDAGNILAGAAAASTGVPYEAAMEGFGALNIGNNNKVVGGIALLINQMTKNKETGYNGWLSEKPYYGENPQSGKGIEYGYKVYKRN